MPRQIMRRELFASVAAGCILAAGFGPSALAETKTFAFEMQQQPLSAALREYASVSGQQIIFAHAIVAGRNAPALHGSYTPDSALALLLDGTGLKTERSTSGAIMIKSASAEGSGPTLLAQRDEAKPAPSGSAGPSRTGAGAAGQSSGVEEIIVTAQKRSENINDVGMSITALSGDQLTKYGISSPESLGDAVAGLSFSRLPSGPPVFSIRGIGFPEVITAGAPGVSTYVDEVPMPYSLMTVGAALDTQRVEVLKGPQGTLYGQNVTGGAINFIANKPTNEFAVGLDASYGSYDQINATGFISGPLAARLKARLALGVDHMGDWQKSYTRNEKRGESSVYMGRMLLDWDPTDELTFTLSANGWIDKSDELGSQLIGLSSPFSPLNFNGTARKYSLTPDDARHADWTPGLPFGALDPVTGAFNDSFSRDNDYHQLALRGEYQLGGSTTLTSITAWQRLRQRSLADADGTTANNWNTGSATDIKVFSQELRLSGGAHRLKWLIGANYQTEGVTNSASVMSDVGFFPFKATASIGHSDLDTYAAFAHLEYELLKTLTVIAGIRYTDVTIHNNSCSYDGDGNYAGLVTGIAASKGVFLSLPRGSCITLNPATYRPGIVSNVLHENNIPFTAGLNWKVTPDALIYASVSQGYKTGGFTLSGATFAQGFDPARQEAVLAYETGVKLGLDHNRLQINGALYYYDYKDKQVRGQYNDPVVGNLNKLLNIPHSRTLGGELQVTWVPDDHWRINGGAAYTDGEVGGYFTNLDALGRPRNLEGTMLPFTPLWQLVGDVEYGFPVASAVDAFIGAHAKYQSKSYSGLGENALLKLDAYTNIDVRLGVRSEDQRWSATLFAKNATDEYSWRAATLAGTDAITRTANLPRIFGIRLSVRN